MKYVPWISSLLLFLLLLIGWNVFHDREKSREAQDQLDQAKIDTLSAGQQVLRAENAALRKIIKADQAKDKENEQKHLKEMAFLKRKQTSIEVKVKNATIPEIDSLITVNYPGKSDTLHLVDLKPLRSILSDALVKPSLEAMIVSQSEEISRLDTVYDRDMSRHEQIHVNDSLDLVSEQVKTKILNEAIKRKNDQARKAKFWSKVKDVALVGAAGIIVWQGIKE